MVDVDDVQILQTDWLVEVFLVVADEVVLLLSGLEVVLQILLDGLDVLDRDGIVHDQALDALELANVALVVGQDGLAVLDLASVGLLALAGAEGLDLQVLLLDGLLQLLDELCHPLAAVDLGLLLRGQLLLPGQPLLGVRLGLGLLLADLELLHLGLDELPVLDEGVLVLDVRAADPALDLVPQPLQLLDLLLEVALVLLLLVLLLGAVHLLPYFIE